MDKIKQRIKELEDGIEDTRIMCKTDMAWKETLNEEEIELKGFKEGVAMERERIKELIDKLAYYTPHCDQCYNSKFVVKHNELLQAIDSENKSNTNKEKTE